MKKCSWYNEGRVTKDSEWTVMVYALMTITGQGRWIAGLYRPISSVPNIRCQDLAGRAPSGHRSN